MKIITKKIKENNWLIGISKHSTINCPDNLPKTEVIESNSLLKLEYICVAYVGTTQIHKNVTKMIEVPFVSF